MGSGKILHNAFEKYGIENFKKDILFECSSVEEMNNKEKEIVNEDFLNRNDTYNLKIGGDGGWDFVNKTGLNNSNDNCSKGGKRNASLNKDPERRKWYSNKIRSGFTDEVRKNYQKV